MLTPEQIENLPPDTKKEYMQTVLLLEEKRKQQELDAEKAFEPFKDIILDNAIARPELVSQLEAMKDEYFENIKTSEKIFRNKKSIQDAANANSVITVKLRAYQKDLEARDLALQQINNPAKFNSLAEDINDVSYRDRKLAERLIYKDDGIYAANHLGEEVRLSEFKPLVQKNQAGIDSAIDIQRVARSAGSKLLDYEADVLPSLKNNLNKLMDDSNWGSLLFDNIGPFNWAEQEMKDRDITDIEAFRAMVKADPKLYKEEFISDLERAYRIDFEEAKKDKQAELNKATDQDSEESIKDIDLAIKNINDGLPISLSSITGESEDGYTNIIPDPEDKDKYVYAKKGGEILEGYPKLSTQDLAKLLNVPLIRLTGAPSTTEDEVEKATKVNNDFAN